MPALTGVGEAEHLDRLPAGLCAHVGVRDLLQEQVVADHVRPRIEQHAVALQPVASGAPDLLGPRLDAARHVAVDHEAHVALVDPHAERHGRDHHVQLVARERVLGARALFVREPGVVGARAHAVAPEPLAQALHRLAALRVHDAALAGAPPHDPQHVAAALAPAAFLLHRDAEVGPVEGALVAGGLAHPELADDVARHAARGGGGERQHRDAPQLLAQPGEPPVGGAEIVAPLADAVRLVHHHQAHAAPGDDPAQRALEPFGRHVEQLEFAAAQRRKAPAALLGVDRGVDDPRVKAVPRKGIHLILHQRDEGGDDQHGAGQDAGRDLEGERLTRAGRHERDAVAPGEHGVDHRALPGAELAVAEHLLQHLLRIGETRGDGGSVGGVEHGSLPGLGAR
jgi:hypothetical protein